MIPIEIALVDARAQLVRASWTHATSREGTSSRARRDVKSRSHQELAVIVGLGIDIIEIERIARSLERHADSLLERLLTEREREFASHRKGSALAAHVAGRFAAKEAALKALGSGLADGLRWHDVEIVASALHAPPSLELHGLAAEIAQRRGMIRKHVSISHGQSAATAVVVLEGAD